MKKISKCDICGASPMEVYKEYTLTGAGFNGGEVIVLMAKVGCPAGHRYDTELDSIEDKFS